MEEITTEETLQSWLDNFWTNQAILEYKDKPAMLDAISEYKAGLPQDPSSLYKITEVDTIRIILETSINSSNKEDAITQFANIADLRRFRVIAISFYEGLTTNGVDHHTAQNMGIDAIDLMNDEGKTDET